MIDISPTSIPPFTLTERFDPRAARLMMALAPTVPELNDLTTSGFGKYAAVEGGQVRVQYREWSGQGIGRFHIKALDKDDEEVDMVTQANIWNWAKAAACPRYYKDCDISNCHPVLLVQMCKQYGVPCETLERCNEERDALIAETGLDKRQFKQLFFSGVMYHPTCDDDQLARKLKRFGIDSEPQLFTALRQEMRVITERLLALQPCYLEYAKSVKGDDYYNLPGTALAYVVQTAEKRCVHALYQFWCSKGIDVGALIHDGLHVSTEAQPEHLAAASAYIREKTGFDVRLEFKEFQPHPEFERTLVANDMSDCVAYALEHLAGRIVRCLGRVWFRDDGYQWHSGKETTLRLIAAAIEKLPMFVEIKSGFASISRNVTVQGGIAHKHTVAKELYNAAPIDDEFIDNIRRANVGKLVFENGYWDFEKGLFAEEMMDCLARVPCAFPERNAAHMKDVHKKIIEPILGNLEPAMMCWLARGLAGYVSDKTFGMWQGERNSGKSVLIHVLSEALGEALVKTLNSESFMCKGFNVDADSDKAQGFLLPVEHARLIFTSELEMDANSSRRLNGALLKKFVGGDRLHARALYQDPCSFFLAGRLCIAGNDCPEISPADAVQTMDYFQSPRVFVPHGDKRLFSDPLMYRPMNDQIRDYCCTAEAKGAIVHLLLDAFGRRVHTSEMAAMRDEFVSGGDERENFFGMIEVTRDENDTIPASQLQLMVQEAQIPMSSRRYNRWLKGAGAKVNERQTIDGRQVRVVRGIKRKHAAFSALDQVVAEGMPS